MDKNHLESWKKKKKEIPVSDPNSNLQIAILRGWGTEIPFKQTSLNNSYVSSPTSAVEWHLECIICYLSQKAMNETTKTCISYFLVKLILARKVCPYNVPIAYHGT